MIRVLLVDDHPLMRRLLRDILESCDDITVTGEAANGEEAVTLAAALNPTVVLLDVHLPTMTGVQATALIKQRSPSTAIIGLTALENEYDEPAMVAAGATALLSKEKAVVALYASIIDAVRLTQPTS